MRIRESRPSRRIRLPNGTGIERKTCDGGYSVAGSLVIPAHNEAENIGQIMRECALTLPKLAPHDEILLVNDGSTDQTDPVAKTALGSDEARLRIVRPGAVSTGGSNWVFARGGDGALSGSAVVTG